MQMNKPTHRSRRTAYPSPLAPRPSPLFLPGFTLIELLLVLVILAVLAALVVPKFAGRSQQAKETAAKTDVSNLETAIGTYEIDNSGPPSKLDDLLVAPSGVTGWHGPYIARLPKDPWGHDYVYKNPGQFNTTGFDVYSLGTDGREGNDDIGNWTAK